jgi:hypothetical protein
VSPFPLPEKKRATTEATNLPAVVPAALLLYGLRAHRRGGCRWIYIEVDLF